MTAESVAIAKLARERLAQGWCKNFLENNEGNVCSIGAVSYARDEMWQDGKGMDRFRHVAPIYTALEANVPNIRPDVYEDYVNCYPHRIGKPMEIDEFNDWGSVSKEDVLDLFDLATKELERDA